MSTVWSVLTRATGWVAAGLVLLSVSGGLLVSARAGGHRRRPSWWLDLHRQLGGLALGFTSGHVVTALVDAGSGIGPVEVLIPMTATGWEWGITWGVLATYVVAAVVLTSWPARRFRRRVWIGVHLVSLPASIMVAAHAWMVGSSRNGRWVTALLAVSAGMAVYPAVLRMVGIVERRRGTGAAWGTVPSAGSP